MTTLKRWSATKGQQFSYSLMQKIIIINPVVPGCSKNFRFYVLVRLVTLSGFFVMSIPWTDFDFFTERWVHINNRLVPSSYEKQLDTIVAWNKNISNGQTALFDTLSKLIKDNLHHYWDMLRNNPCSNTADLVCMTRLIILESTLIWCRYLP